MMTYIIGYKAADIVNFDIRRNWFVKCICTSGLQTVSLITE